MASCTPSIPQQVHNCGLPPLGITFAPRQQLPTALSMSAHMTASCMPLMPQQVHNCGLLALGITFAPRLQLPMALSMSAHMTASCMHSTCLKRARPLEDYRCSLRYCLQPLY